MLKKAPAVRSSTRLAHALGGLGLASLGFAASAAPGASTIEQVLVYPGGATVTRVAAVPAGAREMELSCLSARFDLDSLQVQGSEGLRLGELSVQTLERARLPECEQTPLVLRLRELEAQKAAKQAEFDAQGLALGYLKALGDGRGTTAPAASTIGANADAVRRSGLEALQRQQALAPQLDELERQIAPVRAEVAQLKRLNPTLRKVTVRLATQAAAQLRLSYRLQQAGWTPVYRAELDTTTGQVRLERQAQVAQTSGEDWRGVNLRLATQQTRQDVDPPSAEPWTLTIRPPVQAAQFNERSRAMAAAAPAPMALRGKSAPEEADVLPQFDVSVFQGEFDAEFVVPGQVNVGTDGQAVTLKLGDSVLPSQLYARTQPQQSAQAYLVADVDRPAGSWPRGQMQMFRDGRFVGQSAWSLGERSTLSLGFGIDEQVRVQVAPEQRNAGSAGFIGSRSERSLSHVYTVQNLHKRAVTLQLIEPTPVAQHEDLKVTRRLDPAPTQSNWQDMPGVALWQLPLAAGQSVTLRADYQLSAPKDAVVDGWR